MIRRKNTLKLKLSALVVAWAVVLCMPTGGRAASKAKTVDRIIAVVGGDIILLSEVEKKAQTMLDQLQKASQSGQTLMAEHRREKAIKEALDQIINSKLVAQQAREMELKVTSDEIDRTVVNMAKENNIDMETFRKAIQAQGMTFTEYRAQIRDQILRFKVLNLKVRGRANVSESEARQYYNNQVRDVRATGAFEGAHILLRVPQGASAAEVAQIRDRAMEIKNRVQTTGEFAETARQVSEDKVTAPHGGSLGMRKVGTIPKVLDRAFLDLEVGEVTGPIRSQVGFHIIRLNDRQALGVQSFKEVKNRIINQLTQEEMTRQEKIWIKELRQKTFIDIRL